MTNFRLILASLVLFGGLAGSATAQSFVEHQKLLASDGSPGDEFGWNVSVSGDHALIGANHDKVYDKDHHLGSVYIFERQSNGEWIEVQTLRATGGKRGFGYSVSVSGDRALIGAYLEDAPFNESGSAYMFERQANGRWLQTQRLTAGDASAPYGFFGRSVSLSRDSALIGAGKNSTYVFDRQANGTWRRTQKLIPSDQGGGLFGHSVAATDDHALIGRPYDDAGGAFLGSVDVFERQTTGTWIAVQKLTASDAADYDSFGLSVAVSHAVALVGSRNDDDDGTNSGSVYVYERQSNGTWIEAQKLTASDATLGDFFGGSVSVSGDRALIGASGDDDNGAKSGSAYVFERQANGTWLQTQKLTASNAAANDFFGSSVSVSGDHVLIGATSIDFFGSFGSNPAYVFEVRTCATDLGFQGPGNIEISTCGDDLTLHRSTATFLVTQAPPSSAVILFGSLSSNPTLVPNTLGTLVPLPVLAGFPMILATDTNGSLTLPVTGSANSPVTVYLQALAANSGILEFSNAIQLTIGI